MPRPPTATVDQRLKRIPHLLALLREQPLAAEDLLIRVNRLLAKEPVPEISLRTLQHDLEWMQEHLGNEVIERVPRSSLEREPTVGGSARRWFYRINGAEELIAVSSELCFVSEMEAIALRTAQALLAGPPNPDRTPADPGPLAAALDRLTNRLGLGVKDSRIPDIIGVNLSTPEPYEADHILALLRAIRLGQAVEMQYASLGKPAHAVVAQPIRLVLTDAEPYVWAWDQASQKLKNYKVARILSLVRRASLTGVPTQLDKEVRASVSKSFRGVAGTQQTGRVVLRVDKAGVPHLRGRRLGGVQVTTDLPDGSVRVEFNTAGLDAVKHWLLQFGALAVAEAPKQLVTWMREQSQAMAARYR